ncbi:hypothetical protein P3T76_015078 [Phytophthora citrophthora]|uniref:Uncharacterized protein n=1 Tax=Phytophthora citrophthora TaxID=4793 RepID=A0AAD9LAN6_9STRA|nr:hypothetical protein P3T76_015078 [Phytophthora citrophthora]
MARSKEQWKAQQRGFHTQATAKSFFQMKRPISGSGLRPTALPVNAALFQLGRPAAGAPPVSPDPSGSGGSSAQAIDLTLEDEEEEDEPMGTQETENATSDAVKLRVLDGTYNEPNAVAQSLQSSDLPVPFAEDIESDVDEDWPEVPQSEAATSPSTAESVGDQLPRAQTKEDVMAALTAICKQKDSNLEQNAQGEVTNQQTSAPLLHADSAADIDEMEVEENGELPNQATEAEEDATNSLITSDQAVRVDHLEDGEIFEEGAPRKPIIQQVIARDSPLMGTGMRPHQRNKKQKKRGKKKTKRKLEAMQMMHTPAGEMLPEFERLTRQRPFSDAPPPGQYTLAMMRNGAPSGAMNMRPMFQDSASAPFQSGSLVSGGQHPLMRPSPQHQTPPLPPPLPYEDSQILRVNRQGSMEMLGCDDQLMFAAPPMQGGFKYRTVVSIPPPRPRGNGPSNFLQRSVSDQSRPFPIGPQSHSDGSKVPPNRERKKSEDFDLDSLRAAALRSKVNRSVKASTSTLTPTTPTVDEMSVPSSLPPSPKSANKEESNSEPASPEDEDELRLEILRSMKRKRKQIALKSSTDDVPVASVNVPSAVEMDVQEKLDECSKPVDTNTEVEAPTQPESVDVAEAESVVDTGACCEADNTTVGQDEMGTRNQAEAPLTRGSVSVTPSVEQAVTTWEVCPLTACSQSLVIRLSPEDFSPREGGDEHRTKTTLSNSLHNAIKEMRRKIAEREKEQTSRLLVNATGRLSQSSGSSSSSESSAATPSNLHPQKKVSTLVAQAADVTATYPEVSSAVTEHTKKSSCAARAELGNPGKDVPLKQVSAIETLPPAATAGCTAKPLETQDHGDTSGVSTFVNMPRVLQPQVPAISDRRNGDSANASCVKKSIEPVAAA